MAPARATPVLVAAARTNAKIPIGATAMIQSTIVVVAFASAPKKATSARRSSGAICLAANANRKVKTITGSIAPSAEAFTTLGGTNDVTHAPSATPCLTSAMYAPAWAVAANRSAAAAWVVSFMSSISGGPNNNATTAASAKRQRKATSVSMPIQHKPALVSWSATATKSNETTSGTIVMRIALTHNCPNGATNPTTRSAIG